MLDGDRGAHAIELAARNWAVLPLDGKIPFKGTRGVLDATTDVTIVAELWGVRYRGANIGARVPIAMFVIDVDPRNGGLESLAALEEKVGPFPTTMRTISGRRDGGCHYFFRRPPGKLSGAKLGPGIDLKSNTGYTVHAPSIHPDTGLAYERIDAPIAAPPPGLVDLVVVPVPAPAPPRGVISPTNKTATFTASSIADAFSTSATWAEILLPHGWSCVNTDPDADGAIWLHPKHTSSCSATIRNGCLFVWSTSTVFDVSEPGSPKGYTRFRAYAVLNNDGDLSAAARALRGVV